MTLDALTARIVAIDGLVWQPFAMPLVLVVVGGLITLATGIVQVRRFPLAVRMVLRGAFGRGRATEATITPFQALSTALASTVGNGNIGGVATAILIGGAGAIFWMWVCAAVGMATKYAEAVLGVHYRVTRETGQLASGPMYYISRGISAASWPTCSPSSAPARPCWAPATWPSPTRSRGRSWRRARRSSA
jgi:AGCS family alanine or glycine:cation symporter